MNKPIELILLIIIFFLLLTISVAVVYVVIRYYNLLNPVQPKKAREYCINLRLNVIKEELLYFREKYLV
jgi:predicted membrane protein